MDFYTNDSKLSIENGKLIIKKLKVDAIKSYWFDSFILIGLLIAYQMDEAVHGEPYRWVLVIAAFFWIYPHLERIFKILFINQWGNTINLNKITDIIQPKPDNELETKVIIKLKSGRRKEFVFRTAEHQADNFLNTLRELTSPGTFVTNGYS